MIGHDINPFLGSYDCGYWLCNIFGGSFGEILHDCLRSGLQSFMPETTGYGNEANQTGALQRRIHEVLKDNAGTLQSAMTGGPMLHRVSGSPYFIVRSVAFRTREEASYGPDLAFVVVTDIPGMLQCGRFFLIQAKVVGHTSPTLRIDLKQLQSLLEASARDSYYMFWNASTVPAVIPALAVDSALIGSRGVADAYVGERMVPVPRIAAFCKSLPFFFVSSLLSLWAGASLHDAQTKPPAFDGPLDMGPSGGRPCAELREILHRKGVPLTIVAYQGVSPRLSTALFDVQEHEEYAR